MMSRFIRGIRTLGVTLAAVLILALALVLSPAAADADPGTLYNLSGTVTVLPGTTPIDGVSVTVSDASTGNPVASALTGSDGFYSTTVQAGTYILQFTPPVVSAFKPATTQPTTVNADTTVDIGLVHVGLERLAGTITDLAGNPVSGLHLEFSNSSTAESTSTDSSGAYQVSLPDGTYNVDFDGSGNGDDLPGGYDETGSGLVVSGDVTANYTLAADPLDVTVLGPDGTPVVGASVHTGNVFGAGGSASLFGITYNNEDNAGPVDTGGSGTARLWLFGGTGLSGSIAVTPPAGSGLAEAIVPVPDTINGETAVTVHLQSTATLAGTITDLAGNPVSGLHLEFSNSSTAESTSTDSSGAYQVSLPDGTYNVDFDGSGNGDDLPGGYDETGSGLVVSGDVTANYTLAADPLDVTVLGPDGTPVVGASVHTGNVFGAGGSASLFGITYNNEDNAGPVDTGGSGTARLWLFGGTGLSGSIAVTPPAGSGLAEANIPVPDTINGETAITVSYAGGAASAVSLTPTHLDFGSVDTRSQSAAQSIDFTNVLGPGISVSAVTLAGADPSDFTVSNDTCSGASLAQGAGCTVDVTFAPGSGGAQTATLQIADSGPGSPHSVTLTGTGVITQASQSISFPATGVTYGQADFSPATASSGLPVTYSQPSGQCQVDSQGLVQITGAGSCTITASQSGNNDYQPAPQVTQTFPIAPATLTVNASPATEIYAGTPAALSYTLSGFVNGDTAASAGISGTASCSIAAGTGTDAGTYPGAITCTPGTLTAPDYTFTTGQSGTLTITQATQSVTFTTTPPVGPAYGGSYTPAATATSGLSVAFSIDASSTSGACQLSAGTVSFTGTGTCIIDATQAGNADYSSAEQQQALTIAKKTLTVTAGSYSKLFGAPDPALTVTITGFAFGQTVQNSGVTGQASCTTTATTSSPAGTYPVTCTQGTLAAANYAFTFTPGTLTITATKTITGTQAGPLTVSAGQSVLIGPGATVTGPVTVQAGGALEVEGGHITGPLRSTAATSLRICSATIGGPFTAASTSGLVLIGDDDGSVACAGNTISGPASITGGTGGVEFDDNQVTGPLTITGNTGTLAPPDSGTVDATGNIVSGPTTIQK